MTKEWTLTALNQSMKKDLKKCKTEHERIMCETICKKEIKDAAYEFLKTRKLTPGEMSVLLSI